MSEQIQTTDERLAWLRTVVPQGIVMGEQDREVGFPSTAAAGWWVEVPWPAGSRTACVAPTLSAAIESAFLMVRRGQPDGAGPKDSDASGRTGRTEP